MASLNKVPLPGYGTTASPTRSYWKGDYFGNNNYQVGGDSFKAGDLQMGGFEDVGLQMSALSSSGNYTGKIFMPANSSNNAEQQASCYSSVTIKWYYAANNNEVANNTNLNGESFRLYAVGV